MNIENMTRDEQIKLYHQLEKALGWYGVVTICAEDVKDYMTEREMTIPEDEVIKNACAYVARKADIDHTFEIEWAAELATEIHQDEEQT
jgi:hypothetical protein